MSAFVSAAAGRPKLLWAGGTTMDAVLGGEGTAGALSLVDASSVRGDATPLHVHHGEAEIFYLLEGSITALGDDARFELVAGDAIYLPPGRPHAYAVTSETARLIIVTTSPGFAAFVGQAGVPVTGEMPQRWEFDLGRFTVAAPKQDIEILGPPPF